MNHLDDFMITVVPIAMIALAYFLLNRFWRYRLSKASHAAFRVTLFVLSIWGAYQLFDVMTSSGGFMSGMIMIFWVVFGVPVAAGCYILVWSVVTLMSNRSRGIAGEPDTSRTGKKFARGFISIAIIGMVYFTYSSIQMSTVNNQDAEPEQLRSLYNSWYASWDRDVHRMLARNKSTPEDVLRLLATHEDLYVRKNICFNEATPVSLLTLLAKDKAWQVRSCVARYTDVTLAMYMQLEEDSRHQVYNKALPPELMMQLARDNNDQVRRVMAMNYGAPHEVLAILAVDNIKAVRQLVARRRSLPLDIRLQLAEDKSVLVRKTLLSQMDVPLEVLEKLENDLDEEVRNSVQFHFRNDR